MAVHPLLKFLIKKTNLVSNCNSFLSTATTVIISSITLSVAKNFTGALRPSLHFKILMLILPPIERQAQHLNLSALMSKNDSGLFDRPTNLSLP